MRKQPGTQCTASIPGRKPLTYDELDEEVTVLRRTVGELTAEVVRLKQALEARRAGTAQ